MLDENVFLLQVNQSQLDKLYSFLDKVLKKDGLDVITEVVDIYNVLGSAQKLELSKFQPPTETPVPQPTEENK